MTEHCVQAAVALTPEVGVEETRQGHTNNSVLISCLQRSTVIKIVAAGEPQSAQQSRQ